ncbi:hypothetical protein [Sulfurimonas sp. HSL3-7]|uniref:hypothetical protein n=1 Tax=Sulfonitrofixus jiaomeiensis TaxID=3131938 RepID=UPI0031F732A9
MCDFNNMDDAAKAAYHRQLTKCADAFGGTNFFLQLLEAIRKTKPHPLLAKHMEFRFSRGIVKWNKVIFKDKFTLLTSVRVTENENGNLLPGEDDKNYKKVMNLLRTLQPITFEVLPKNLKDGDGFKVHPFDIVDKKTTRINPVFDALFFCSVDTVKKVLSYTPKAS